MSRLLASLATILLLGSLATPVYADTSPGDTGAASETREETAKVLAKLNGAMEEVGTWVKATGQFALEQTPLLVKEILYWEISFRAFLVSLSALMVLFALWGWRWSYKKANSLLLKARGYKELINEDRRLGREEFIFSFTHYAIPISAGILGIIGAIMFLVSVPDLIKPIVAPRLFLIEYFRAFLGR